jgi:hypothetical protein
MTIENRLAEIKTYEKEQEKLLDARFPEFCDAYEVAAEELNREIRDLKIAAYGEWEKTPAYAAFKAKQIANFRNRAAA